MNGDVDVTVLSADKGDLSGVIVVVSGLPRSGTSMMMRMLAAGGLALLTDGVRAPDDDNPHGYFEFERVKKLRSDASWLPRALGKGLKVISFLLRDLPSTFEYRVVFMHRAMQEVLASQRRMLERRGEPDRSGDARMATLYEKHLGLVLPWAERQPNLAVLHVEHRETIACPRLTAARVNAFLGGGLCEDAMAAAVDATLHRHIR